MTAPFSTDQMMNLKIVTYLDYQFDMLLLEAVYSCKCGNNSDLVDCSADVYSNCIFTQVLCINQVATLKAHSSECEL